MLSSYPKILGTGLICLDIVNDYSSLYYMTGGSCGNVISALSFLGWNSTVIKNRYADFVGEKINSNLEEIGVKCINIGSPIITPRIIEIIDNSGRNSKHKFLFSCPECGKELPKLKPLTEKDSMAIIKDVSKVNVFYTDRISKGISIIRESLGREGTWTFYEPNSSRNVEALIDNSLQSSIVKFSASKVPMAVSNRLRELAVDGVTVLIVRTEGPKGLSVCYKMRNNKMSQWIPLKALQAPDIVDTSGAGDWCTAGLLFRLINKFPQKQKWLIKNDVIEAVQFGQALATISCKFVGAQGLIYSDSQEELERLFSKFINDEFKSEFKIVNYLAPKVGNGCCPICLMPVKDQLQEDN